MLSREFLCRTQGEKKWPAAVVMPCDGVPSSPEMKNGFCTVFLVIWRFENTTFRRSLCLQRVIVFTGG